MANWQTISGAWGTHVADVGLSDAWARESIIRLGAARTLCALGSSTPWTQQRDACLNAWQALANAYLAANLPPPSDPQYRQTMLHWYGQCVTDATDSIAYRVGPLVSIGGGQTLVLLRTAWMQAKHLSAPPDSFQFNAVAVRLSLTSDAQVGSTCLQATGDGDCDYRGLFTGCASAGAAGVYTEHDCNTRYDATTFEWMDYGSTRASPPLRWSLDVLSDLLDAWTSRGNALGVIDATRSFALLSNLANAQLANLLPAAYIAQTQQLEESARAQSTGMGPDRQHVIQAIGVAAAACAAVAGPWAPVCGVAGAVAAVIASVVPAAIGTAVDALGMPVINGHMTASFLPAMIATPTTSASGAVSVALTVPTLSGVSGPGYVPMGSQAAQAALGRTRPTLGAQVQQSATVTPQGGDNSMVLIGAAALAALVMLGKG